MSRLAALCLAAAALTAAAQTQPAADQASDDERIVPFTIRVPDATLDDLKQRLTRARFPEPLQQPDWSYGTDLSYLKELVTYWRDRFDWRAQERKLNQLEQFTTTIDGLQVHFVHRRSRQPSAFPLLVTHGWPGSFVEFTKVVGPLTDPAAHGGRAADAFDVVMPSLPGFGFSGKPAAPGYDPARIAVMEAKLMARLGYQRYGAQGGDWGAIINTQLALADRDHVAGLHLNMCTAAAPAGAEAAAGLSEAEAARMKVRQAFQAEETGYQQIQGTKPQTLGFAPQRLAGRPGGVDRREVPHLVRLRRQPRGDLHEGRAPDQHHPLLGDANGGIVGADLLRVAAPDERGQPREDRRADGVRRFSEGDHLGAARARRRALQPGAVDRDAEGWTLRGVRAAAVVRRRCARVFQRDPGAIDRARKDRAHQGSGNWIIG